MEHKPVGARLVVIPDREESEIEGIVISRVTAPRDLSTGKVVAIGDSSEVDLVVGTQVTIGMRVSFERTASMDIVHNGCKAKIIHAYNISSIITE